MNLPTNYMKGGVMEKQTCISDTTASSAEDMHRNRTALGMHKSSQAITKGRPKIRIIHIHAPEIIKTDVANFRELVQRLTGRPTHSKKRISPVKKEAIMSSCAKPMVNNNVELAMRLGYHGLDCRERIKGEEEIWLNANSGGGFLGGFGECEDGFMQELNQFLFLEGSTQIDDIYGDSRLTQMA